jgi:hypothetical protein
VHDEAADVTPVKQDSDDGLNNGASPGSAVHGSPLPSAQPVYVPDERSWRALPFPDRILTPRSEKDAQWMQMVGYPSEADIRNAPNLANLLDIHDLPLRMQNAVLVREIRAGNPVWRDMAAGLLTHNVFAARLVFDDLMVYERDGGSRTGGQSWLNQMTRAATYALMMGDTAVNHVLGFENRRLQVDQLELTMVLNALANAQRLSGGCQPVLVRPDPPIRP